MAVSVPKTVPVPAKVPVPWTTVLLRIEPVAEVENVPAVKVIVPEPADRSAAAMEMLPLAPRY